MTRLAIRNIVYELTGACNQCCRFCYNYWRDGSSPIPAPQPRLASRTLRELLSQVDVGTISFSGGEPLLLRNLCDLVLRARFKGSQVNILTNGTLLTPDMLERLVNLGVGAVQIPILSADPLVHEGLTQLKGSWEKAVDALKRASEALPGRTYAVLVMTKANVADLPACLEQIASCGVRGVMVNRFNLGGMGLRHAGELVLDRPTLHQAFAQVEAFAATHPELRFVSGVCTPLCFLDPDDFPHILFTSCHTDFRRRPLTVHYNGDVRFCNHSPYVLGNLYRRPLGDILTDPAHIARYSALPDSCRNCALLSRCGGGCRAASEQVYGSFAHTDPLLDTL